MNTKSNISKPVMIFGIVLIIALLLSLLSALKTKSPGESTRFGDSECGKYSTKEGYTGCNSIKIGKTNKCKFRIDNKINEATQKMEFQYACIKK